MCRHLLRRPEHGCRVTAMTSIRAAEPLPARLLPELYQRQLKAAKLPLLIQVVSAVSQSLNQSRLTVTADDVNSEYRKEKVEHPVPR